MKDIDAEGYFDMTDAEKLQIQQFLYVYAHKIMMAINRKRGKDEPEWNIYDVCNLILDDLLEVEEYELVQAMKDTIINYDFKRRVGHK
jgi:hypothetical protein